MSYKVVIAAEFAKEAKRIAKNTKALNLIL
jgi:mRNA-degrading endonuclease RelE of RelBE toxin-antitoxin system